MSYLSFAILATILGIGGALFFGIRAKTNEPPYLLAIFAVPMSFGWRKFFGFSESFSWQAVAFLAAAFGVTYGLYYLGKEMNS